MSIITRLSELIGSDHVLHDPAAMQPYLSEWRRLYHGTCACVAQPGSTAEVAAILRLAHETRTPVVPQGGNTGLVGGQISFDDSAIVLSLSRLNSVRRVDAPNNTLTVEAGCTLAQVQAAAEEAGRLFPLRLASEGSCQIGGTIATNAGGVGVLAYGSMRDLVLGLEVVLTDGRVWHGLRSLRKDNTGYDLKHVFIGSEGTLGVITAAVLKLFPRPRDMATTVAAVHDPAAAVRLLTLLQGRFGRGLTACELMPRFGVEMACRHMPDVRDPFSQPYPWYVLAEVSGFDDSDMRGPLETVLSEAELLDGVIAQSGDQRAALWKLREVLPEAQAHEGGSIKHDISVAISDVPAFLEEATAAALAMIPGCRPLPFGHLGDGNIHFNVSQPAGADKAGFLARWGEMNALIHGIVMRFGGSVAAEHGIGRLKRDLLSQVKPPVELELMRALKKALDPCHLLNPGKMI